MAKAHKLVAHLMHTHFNAFHRAQWTAAAGTVPAPAQHTMVTLVVHAKHHTEEPIKSHHNMGRALSWGPVPWLCHRAPWDYLGHAWGHVLSSAPWGLAALLGSKIKVPSDKHSDSTIMERATRRPRGE